jgi:hypothetical protein
VILDNDVGIGVDNVLVLGELLSEDLLGRGFRDQEAEF